VFSVRKGMGFFQKYRHNRVGAIIINPGTPVFTQAASGMGGGDACI
jgi:hypothetical protein